MKGSMKQYYKQCKNYIQYTLPTILKDNLRKLIGLCSYKSKRHNEKKKYKKHTSPEDLFNGE